MKHQMLTFLLSPTCSLIVAIMPMRWCRAENVAGMKDPPQEGITCQYPYYAEFGPLDHAILIQGSTCYYWDDYDLTCLGFYDGGEDFVVRLTVPQTMVVSIELDPKGTAWTAFAVSEECPFPSSNCMAVSTSATGQPHSIPALQLEPGMYWILIDTFPLPECIEAFDLTITEILSDPFGNNCDLPLPLTIREQDIPLFGGSCTVRTTLDDYNETCLGEFDSGEDLVYELIVEDTLELCVEIDPQGRSGTGFLITTDCTEPITCIAMAVDTIGERYGATSVSMLPGIYYLIVDSRLPMDTPITVGLYFSWGYICGDADHSGLVTISDAVFIINYVFAGGEAPWPAKSGDADESGAISISDAVYLINYIFAGGNEPCTGIN